MNAWDRRNAWLFRNGQQLFWLSFFVVVAVPGVLGRFDDLVLPSGLSEQGTQGAVAVDVMINAAIVVLSLAFIVALARSVRRDWAQTR